MFLCAFDLFLLQERKVRMQEQNLAASEYFKDKERFADLMNGYVYHGQ